MRLGLFLLGHLAILDHLVIILTMGAHHDQDMNPRSFDLEASVPAIELSASLTLRTLLQ